MENKKAYESFRKNLNDYLMQKFNYKQVLIRHIIGNTLMINKKRIRLYLKLPSYNALNTETLVIARIGFQKIKVGNGVSLLRFLISQSTLLGYTNIKIEQTNTNSSYFAKKLGFTQINEKNWIIPLDILHTNIQNKYGVEERN